MRNAFCILFLLAAHAFARPIGPRWIVGKQFPDRPNDCVIDGELDFLSDSKYTLKSSETDAGPVSARLVREDRIDGPTSRAQIVWVFQTSLRSTSPVVLSQTRCEDWAMNIDTAIEKNENIRRRLLMTRNDLIDSFRSPNSHIEVDVDECTESILDYPEMGFVITQDTHETLINCSGGQYNLYLRGSASVCLTSIDMYREDALCVDLLSLRDSLWAHEFNILCVLASACRISPSLNVAGTLASGHHTCDPSPIITYLDSGQDICRSQK